MASSALSRTFPGPPMAPRAISRSSRRHPGALPEPSRGPFRALPVLSASLLRALYKPQARSDKPAVASQQSPASSSSFIIDSRPAEASLSGEDECSVRALHPREHDNMMPARGPQTHQQHKFQYEIIVRQVHNQWSANLI